jgi:hypothetical protein
LISPPIITSVPTSSADVPALEPGDGTFLQQIGFA